MQEIKPMNFNKDKTINQLLDKPIPRPPDFESHLVKRCFDLANKKLAFFSAEDLRIMIGQEIGLKFLVPLALEVLKTEPFIEADFYEGDLFLNVLKIDKSFWENNNELKNNVVSVFKGSLENFYEIDEDTQQDLFNAYNKL